MLFLKDGTMKLADFGLARMYGTPKQRLCKLVATIGLNGLNVERENN
jgi:cyclin-dependent kinase 7